MLIVDENFGEVDVRTAGELIPTHGFSSIKVLNEAPPSYFILKVSVCRKYPYVFVTFVEVVITREKESNCDDVTRKLRCLLFVYYLSHGDWIHLVISKRFHPLVGYQVPRRITTSPYKLSSSNTT